MLLLGTILFQRLLQLLAVFRDFLVPADVAFVTKVTSSPREVAVPRLPALVLRKRRPRLKKNCRSSDWEWDSHPSQHKPTPSPCLNVPLGARGHPPPQASYSSAAHAPTPAAATQAGLHATLCPGPFAPDLHPCCLGHRHTVLVKQGDKTKQTDSQRRYKQSHYPRLRTKRESLRQTCALLSVPAGFHQQQISWSRLGQSPNTRGEKTEETGCQRQQHAYQHPPCATLPAAAPLPRRNATRGTCCRSGSRGDLPRVLHFFEGKGIRKLLTHSLNG